ncbi:P-loop NTPase fold protein [Kitasatospora purpeofusca]|uniref:KAP family P-loop NTPase fold protein n=1 Tax=Kitasatospora purpeofusca TaxID=67352 RepID=UPI0035E2F9C5
MILLTDNPARSRLDDRFGFLPYVEALHTAVAAADPLPLTVGVFGSWGTGKSSFLGMWRDLFQQQGTRTVWFNPWKYDRKVEVWAALLHTILSEMEQEERLRDRVTKLARAATWLSLRAGLGHVATLATGGIVTGADVNNLLDTLTTTEPRSTARSTPSRPASPRRSRTSSVRTADSWCSSTTWTAAARKRP